MFGVGLRSEHYEYLLQKPQTEVDFFEAITENFLDTEGDSLSTLFEIRKDYPVCLHGVSLSIASPKPFDAEYLKKVKNLCEIIDPLIISDHLCWGADAHYNTHDLMPLPFTDDSLVFLSGQIDKLQNFLGRQFVLENTSTYLQFKHNEMEEWEFLAELTKISGCGILLDINNVYVNSYNHDFDPKVYLDEIPDERVKQVHLAGHTQMGEYLYDTHSKEVCKEVWELCKHKFSHLPEKTPILLEWDSDIPDFKKLESEIKKAKKIWEDRRCFP